MRSTDAYTGQHRRLAAMLAAAVAVASLIAVLTLGAGPAAAKTHKVYVKSVSLSQSTAPAGSAIQVNYKVRNRGSSKSGRRTVRFFLTATAAHGLKGIALGSAKVSSGIAPKSTASASKRVTIPPFTPPGSYLVTACISGLCKATTVRVVVTPANPIALFAQLAITPTDGDFETGSGSIDRVFTVTNIGNMTSGLVSVTIPESEAFVILSGGTCGNPLAAGTSCTVTVRFTPQGGDSFAVLNASADPGGTASQPLSGSGV